MVRRSAQARLRHRIRTGRWWDWSPRGRRIWDAAPIAEPGRREGLVVLFLGSIPLALAGVNVPTLFVGFFFLAAVGVPLTALTAPTLDRGRRPHPDDESAPSPESGDRRRN